MSKLTEAEIKLLKSLTSENWNEGVKRIKKNHNGWPEDWYKVVVSARILPNSRLEILVSKTERHLKEGD